MEGAVPVQSVDTKQLENLSNSSAISDLPFTKKERYEFHRNVLTYLQDCARFADNKASLILAILGISLPSFLSQWQGIWTQLNVSSWYWLYFIVIVIATCAYLLALWFAIVVFKPRVTTALSKGLIFFNDIRGYGSINDYLQDARNANPDDLLESVLYQNWVLAQIAAKKFRYISYAVIACVVWIILGIWSIIFIAR